LRWARPVAWVAVVSWWLALGQLVLVAVVVLLAVPRTGRRARPLLLGEGVPTRRTALAAVAAAGLVVGGLWVLPDGRLPVPPGGGAWVTPAYTGRPVSAQPLRTDDGAVPDPVVVPSVSELPGPLGLSVEVDSAWFGAEHCGTLLPDSHERLAALCTSRSGVRLKVLDPRTLRPVATQELPDLPEAGACAEPAPPVLDPAGNLLVATGDRRLLQVATADAADEPALVTEAVVDLAPVVPSGDCVVAVVLDGDERAWFATAAGLVGVVAGDASPVVLDLGEAVGQPLAADRDGVYVTTVEAVHRVVTSAGAPLVGWRTAYETGSGRKPGQRDAGSGSGAVLLDAGSGGSGGRLLAFTDNANPRMHVVVLRAADGGQVCRTQVFEDDASATEAALVPIGDAVVVTNGHGWTGPWRGVLGRRPPGGIARIEADCSTAWTSPEVAPTSGTTLSRATGLLYAWTKRRSWVGVDAWYLTALDARTGRTAWSARGGTGAWADNDGAPVTLAPGGAAFLGTRAGLVRVVDGTRGLRD
jgi:hypothetical protein